MKDDLLNAFKQEFKDTLQKLLNSTTEIGAIGEKLGVDTTSTEPVKVNDEQALYILKVVTESLEIHHRLATLLSVPLEMLSQLSPSLERVLMERVRKNMSVIDHLKKSELPQAEVLFAKMNRMSDNSVRMFERAFKVSQIVRETE